MKPSDWKITGTEEAFDFMIQSKNISRRLKVSKSTVSSYRHKRVIPTLNKMEELLLKGGFSVYEEKVWKINVR